MGTKSKITIQDVEHLARLSRLQLSVDEKEKYRGQIDEILRYMEKLDELDVGGVAPLTHPLPLHNILRKDEPAKALPPEEALRNAPEQKDGLFKVPTVVE
jgi:aspartyl-tRNA(Asn)/glutamyl-tRNA(Gln) amidotransferase subunit C